MKFEVKRKVLSCSENNHCLDSFLKKYLTVGGL